MLTSNSGYNDPELNSINFIKIPYNVVGSMDNDSELSLELYHKNEISEVNKITRFIMTSNNMTYSEVKEYSVKDGVVKFKMPDLLPGKYYPEIMDSEGKLYTAISNEYFIVNTGLNCRVQSELYTVKDVVLKELQPSILLYMENNPHLFKGEKGDKGDKGEPGKEGQRGLRGFQGAPGRDGIPGKDGQRGEKGEKGDKGDKGDPGKDGTVNFDELTEEQLNLLKPEFELEDNGDLYIIN